MSVDMQTVTLLLRIVGAPTASHGGRLAVPIAAVVRINCRLGRAANEPPAPEREWADVLVGSSPSVPSGSRERQADAS